MDSRSWEAEVKSSKGSEPGSSWTAGSAAATVIRSDAAGPGGSETGESPGAGVALGSVWVVEILEEVIRHHNPHTLPTGCIKEVLVA